jgi:hypothetical protein
MSIIRIAEIAIGTFIGYGVAQALFSIMPAKYFLAIVSLVLLILFIVIFAK